MNSLHLCGLRLDRFRSSSGARRLSVQETLAGLSKSYLGEAFELSEVSTSLTGLEISSIGRRGRRGTRIINVRRREIGGAVINFSGRGRRIARRLRSRSRLGRGCGERTNGGIGGRH